MTRQKRSGRRQTERRRSFHRLRGAALAVVAAAGLVAIAVAILASPAAAPPAGETRAVPWARLGTDDVHSLVFLDDGQRLLFGHHGGLLETVDGGRTWSPLPLREDAMSVASAADGSIVVAGHLVFMASRDGGRTWAQIQTDLPNLDIHGFTRDPEDARRMWAYLATGGLWESTDFGAHFTRVREDNVVLPLAVRGPTGTRLLGVDGSGIVASNDDGRSWESLAVPPVAPVVSLTATPDGRIVYAGSVDGLYRSEDGGRTWSETAYSGSAFAIATTPDGANVAIVSRETDFYRSPDGGRSWLGP